MHLEMATGMEFVIGDIPEIITISDLILFVEKLHQWRTFRKKLIHDGRINPNTY